MQYTSGNWTVSSYPVHTSESTVSYTGLPVVDLDTDFALSKESADEAVYQSVKGTDARSHMRIRFGFSSVANIYKDSGIDASLQDVTKTGRQLLVEVRSEYRAVNSVSGAEIIIPQKAHIVANISNGIMVTNDLLQDTLKQLAAVCLDSATNSAILNKMNDLAKGALRV